MPTHCGAPSQRALRRAAGCKDKSICIATARHSAKLLEQLLLEQLQSLLVQSVSAKLAGATLASAQAVGAAAAASGLSVSAAGAASLAVSAAGATRQPGVLRALNALQLCCEYTPRLWQQAMPTAWICARAAQSHPHGPGSQARAEFEQGLPEAVLAGALAALDERAQAVEKAMHAALQASS